MYKPVIRPFCFFLNEDWVSRFWLSKKVSLDTYTKSVLSVPIYLGILISSFTIPNYKGGKNLKVGLQT